MSGHSYIIFIEKGGNGQEKIFQMCSLRIKEALGSVGGSKYSAWGEKTFKEKPDVKWDKERLP